MTEIEQGFADIIKKQNEMIGTLTQAIERISETIKDRDKIFNALLMDYAINQVNGFSVNQSDLIDSSLVVARRVFCRAFPERCDEFDDEKLRSHLSIVK